MKYIEHLLKHNRFFQRVYIVVFSALFRFLGIFVKTNPKQVLFQSLKGKNYGDSPRVIFEAMKTDPFFKGYTYVWAFDKPDQFEVEGAKKVRLNSLAYFLTALGSGIWIANVNIERGLQFKKRHTIYLNTWHGCGPLKKDGNSQGNRKDYNFSKTDIVCAGSDWQKSFFMDAMKAQESSIIRCGMPRNDALYHCTAEEVQELKERYHLPENKKVILYAPTWRENEDGTIPLHLKLWKEILADDYVLLFRAHHLTCEAMGIVFDDFVRDYSGAYDVNDLMKMSDILISDYSSIVADYAILERPILLYAYDYEAYLRTRGLYKRLEDLIPGSVFEHEEDLISQIKNMDVEDNVRKVCAFKAEYVYPLDNSTGVCVSNLKEEIQRRANPKESES